MQRAAQPPIRSRGFTLIEVLVALAVIAIGLVAVLAVAARNGRIDAGLEQRTFAAWVAENQLERMRLATTWPGIGESDGKVELADQHWHWKAKVEKTQDPDLRRVTLSVSIENAQDKPITRLIGFIGRPLSKPVGLPGAGADRSSTKKGGG